jgi:hypothetical protein
MNYYAISENLDFKEYDSPENAAKSGALYILKLIKVTDITIPGGTVTKKYEIEIYNKDLKPSTFRSGAWSVKPFKSFIGMYSGSGVSRFNVIDPNGQVKEVRISRYEIKGIIVALIEYLRNISKFNTWEEYELNIENIKLRTELEKHQSKKDNKEK